MITAFRSAVSMAAADSVAAAALQCRYGCVALHRQAAAAKEAPVARWQSLALRRWWEWSGGGRWMRQGSNRRR